MNEPLHEVLQMGHVTFSPHFKIKITDTLREHLQGVRSFTTTFGQPAPESPAVPHVATAFLRDALFNEECDELKGAKTLTSCLDAVCDQLYVVLGNAVACGFSAKQINRGLAEVHRSNMTKLWTSAEFESANLPDGATSQVVASGQLIVRSREGKILKPPGYSPANLSWIEEDGK
jgi:hypothetical protein